MGLRFLCVLVRGLGGRLGVRFRFPEWHPAPPLLLLLLLLLLRRFLLGLFLLFLLLLRFLRLLLRLLRRLLLCLFLRLVFLRLVVFVFFFLFLFLVFLLLLVFLLVFLVFFLLLRLSFFVLLLVLLVLFLLYLREEPFDDVTKRLSLCCSRFVLRLFFWQTESQKSEQTPSLRWVTRLTSEGAAGATSSTLEGSVCTTTSAMS